MESIDPKESNHALTKAILGSIPVAGPFAIELYSLIVRSPLEKRVIIVLNELGVRLRKLEEQQGISLKDLSNDDQFIDTVLEAVNLATRTSEKEKQIAFQNAIINTASGLAPEKAKAEVFLNFIDSFTVWHIRILNFIDNPKAWHDETPEKLNPMSSTSLWSILQKAFPELKGQLDFAVLIWSDLERASFHDNSDLRTNMTVSALLVSRTSNFGKEFLQFIQTKVV